MPNYRCFCCENDAGQVGREFASADKTPACPACGEPYLGEDKGHVSKVAVIHYDRPVSRRRGVNHAACDPALKVGSSGKHFTGEPSAVTCDACKRTPAWKDDAAARGVPAVPEHLDVPVILDPGSGVKPAEV